VEAVREADEQLEDARTQCRTGLIRKMSLS
jgi:hypothetical protein